MCILLLLFTAISTIFCQSTTNIRCYQNATTELDKVLQLYKNPPNFSAPNEFEDIKKLISRTKLIVSKIKKPDELEKKLDNVENMLNKTKDDIELIKTGEDLLEEINERLKKLKQEQNLNNKTQDECSKAKQNYKLLNEDFQEIQKQNEKIVNLIGKITPDINRINIESMDIKRKVDKVQIPYYLSEKYMCHKNFSKSFKELTMMIRKIKNLLQDIRDKIRADLKDIKEKLKTNEIDTLEDILLNKKQLRQDIKYFQNQYDEVSKLKELLDEKQQAKQSLEEIKNIAFHLCRNDVCSMQKVVVEN